MGFNHSGANTKPHEINNKTWTFRKHAPLSLSQKKRKEHHLPDNPDTRAAHYCDEYTINTRRVITTQTPSLRTKRHCSCEEK